MYPEALLHPEVKLLDEGLYLLILTLAQCPSIHQSALVTMLSDALSLDEVDSLTLGVILFYQSAPVKIYQEAISFDEADLLTLGVILFYQAASVKIQQEIGRAHV